MKSNRSHFLFLAASALVMSVISQTAMAQTYPTRPVTLVVPFAAGGPSDVVARILASRMTELLGQSVIIENVGGAGGMTGSARVAKAPPDGYLFGMGHSGTHAYNQSLYKKPLYNARSEERRVGKECRL